MQIVEVKNNLVRIAFDSQDGLILSGFTVIKDSTQSFIAQIIHLETNQGGNFAILKLLFTFDANGVISSYNGAVPHTNSTIESVETKDLLELLPLQNPILIGELAQQKTLLHLDRKLLEEKLLVCCEKNEYSEVLTENLALQLAQMGKKVLVIDYWGTYNLSGKKIIAGENFKLPLNYDTINFIYEKGLEDAKAETKALIQDIFLEVQNYVKTLSEKFIPFETFKDVVDSQYEELGLVELVLLKNKLLKYYEQGVFAQNKVEFTSLEKSFNANPITVFDISKMGAGIQRELISYAYSTLNSSEDEVYIILNIQDDNSDKKLLKQIYTSQNVYSTIIAEYSYKYLKELKQLSKNLVLFAPLQQQNDFAGYSVFLSKLNPSEFIIYGNTTHHLPLIVKLEPVTKYIQAETEHQLMPEEEIQPGIIHDLDEKINEDLEEIYSVPKSKAQEQPELVPELETDLEDELTEEDLDLIEDLNFGQIEEDLEENDFDEASLPIEEPEIQETFDLDELYIEETEATETEETAAEEEEEEEIQPVEEISNEIFEEETSEFEIPEQSFAQVVNEQKNQAPEIPTIDILPARAAATPIVPIYSADIEPQAESDEFVQGDVVVHPKYGKGTVEKLITYGSKTLCSINFDNIGRRLLDPSLAEIKKSD